MYRASTPTHRFKLPVPINTLQEVRICYSQRGKVVLLKTLSTCCKDEDDNVLVVDLAQEDTCCFSEGTVQIQLRVKLTTGKVMPCKRITVLVEDVLDDEVM